MKQGLVWLASYPRSGNTLLRTILWQCFGLKSGSVYQNDLGDNAALKDYVGHLDAGADGKTSFPASNRHLALMKTHGYPRDASPAMYVVRDGRAACASLWQFYRGEVSLPDVLAGRHRFRTWGEHIHAWDPWQRPNTLLLQYEQMLSDLPGTLQAISDFLGCAIVQHDMPSREMIARADGQWVRPITDWQDVLQGELQAQFDAANHDMLKKLGYFVS